MGSSKAELGAKLKQAVEHHWVDVVRGALRGGADATAWYQASTFTGGPYNRSLLHLAFGDDRGDERNARAIVELLLDAGAEIDGRDELQLGSTPLMLAAHHNWPSVVELLLERGADPSVTDDYGKTALDHARRDADRKGRDDRILDLLTRFTKQGRPDQGLPAAEKLFRAVEAQDEEEVRALIDAGADVNARDRSGDRWTALMHAAFCERPEVVRLLIARGADPALTDARGQTVFGLILAQNDHRFHEVLTVLTETTADGKAWLDSPQGLQWRRAHQVDASAPVPASPAEVTEILRRGFYADGGETQRQIVHWVESGGNLDWRAPNGWTLLHLAAQCGNETMVRFLSERGADLEARDDHGETPLMLACETGWQALRLNPAVVRALLELGADPRAEGPDGRTALDLVRSLDAPVAKEIARLLEQHRE